MKKHYKNLLAVALSMVSICADAASYDIMAWGLKPTVESSPYVTSLRIGCNGTPQSCISAYKPQPKIKYIAISFEKPNDADETLKRASEYSTLSLSNPQLHEIDIDDFMAFMGNINGRDKGAYLVDLTSRVKSKNPKLNFGITLYEDQVARIHKEVDAIPVEARNKIDRVALYLHFRQNWDKYQQYVADTKRLFPNARIYGGVYHYDRRDYIACGQGDKRKCTATEENDLFQRSLELQKQMLQAGQLAGLELYPGAIGTEDTWPEWSSPALCASDRLSDCVSASKNMGRKTLQMLK